MEAYLSTPRPQKKGDLLQMKAEREDFLSFYSVDYVTCLSYEISLDLKATIMLKAR